MSYTNLHRLGAGHLQLALLQQPRQVRIHHISEVPHVREVRRSHYPVHMLLWLLFSAYCLRKHNRENAARREDLPCGLLRLLFGDCTDDNRGPDLVKCFQDVGDDACRSPVNNVCGPEGLEEVSIAKGRGSDDGREAGKLGELDS